MLIFESNPHLAVSTGIFKLKEKSGSSLPSPHLVANHPVRSDLYLKDQRHVVKAAEGRSGILPGPARKSSAVSGVAWATVKKSADDPHK